MFIQTNLTQDLIDRNNAINGCKCVFFKSILEIQLKGSSIDDVTVITYYKGVKSDLVIIILLLLQMYILNHCMCSEIGTVLLFFHDLNLHCVNNMPRRVC